MTIGREAPKTPVEAVTLGLYLALIAPTEEASFDCVRMVDSIATTANLSEEVLETAKALALAEFHLRPLS